MTIQQAFIHAAHAIVARAVERTVHQITLGGGPILDKGPEYCSVESEMRRGLVLLAPLIAADLIGVKPFNASDALALDDNPFEGEDDVQIFVRATRDIILRNRPIVDAIAVELAGALSLSGDDVERLVRLHTREVIKSITWVRGMVPPNTPGAKPSPAPGEVEEAGALRA